MIEDKAGELGLTLPMPADIIAAAVVALNDGFYLQKVVDAKRFPPDFLGQLLLQFFGGLVAVGTQPVSQVLQSLDEQMVSQEPHRYSQASGKKRTTTSRKPSAKKRTAARKPAANHAARARKAARR
jgi:hypothetical protein